MCTAAFNKVLAAMVGDGVDGAVKIDAVLVAVVTPTTIAC